MVRQTGGDDGTESKKVTEPGDLSEGDVIDVTGPSFLPKSALTVDRVGVDYDHPYNGTVVEASLDRSNARTYSFLITDGGFVKTTNSAGYFKCAVDMRKRVKTFEAKLEALVESTDASPSEVQDALFAKANEVAGGRWD